MALAGGSKRDSVMAEKAARIKQLNRQYKSIIDESLSNLKHRVLSTSLGDDSTTFKSKPQSPTYLKLND